MGRWLPGAEVTADSTARVSIVVCSTGGADALRSALRSIRASVNGPLEIVVLAASCDEEAATYLTRQYMRGRVAACELVMHAAAEHCGLGPTAHLVTAEYVVRTEDAVVFSEGWLPKAIAAFEDDAMMGCLSLLEPPGRRGRGRPPKIREEPQELDHVDTRCFVTRRDLLTRHGCGVAQRAMTGACAFQDHLRANGLKLAYLPGQAVAPTLDETVRAGSDLLPEGELPAHLGPTGAMRRVEQVYRLGDDVLVTCMACGNTELEVLGARVLFCENHGVAIGIGYDFRCPECGGSRAEDDLQFRCPR
jgi:hypothetical protein